MKNAKRKGTRNKHRSKALLEAAGYAVCRAAASLGAWDLVGISATDVVLVQCKTRDWPGTAEMEALRDFPAPSNARKLVHRWRDRCRVPDVRAV
jgi:Holliday junction resolvase